MFRVITIVTEESSDILANGADSDHALQNAAELPVEFSKWGQILHPVFENAQIHLMIRKFFFCFQKITKLVK